MPELPSCRGRHHLPSFAFDERRMELLAPPSHARSSRRTGEGGRNPMRSKHVVAAGALLVGLMTGVALARPAPGATSTLLSAGTRNAHARQSANADAQVVDVAFLSSALPVVGAAV